MAMEIPINLEYRLTAINAGYCEYRLTRLLHYSFTRNRGKIEFERLVVRFKLYLERDIS